MTERAGDRGAATTQELFPGLTHRRQPDVDTITWSNRHIPKNTLLYSGYLVGLVVITPIALFLSVRLIDDLRPVAENVSLGRSELAISIFFVLASWGGIATISHYLVRLSWTETIKVSNEEIWLHYNGLFAPPSKRIAGSRIWCLSFERVGNERDQESRFTLNLFDIDDKRQPLAYWIRAEESYRLFLLLEAIFNRRGWSVQSRSTFKRTR